MRHGQPVVEQLFGNGKDGGIDADGQSQGGCRHGGEAGALAQDAQAVANVAPRGKEGKKGARLQLPFAQYGRVAELTARCKSGIVRRHPLPQKSIGQHSQVFLHFIIELPIGFLQRQQPRDLCKKGMKRSHHRQPCLSSRNTRPITPEMRSQFSVSRASCFRPDRVME